MEKSAQFHDAAAGWAIYRRLEGKVNRPDLNLALNDQGFQKISPRTYTHYGKLFRLGYREYVSINRLDLRHSNQSVFDVADRSRYQDQSFQSAGTLIIPRGRDYRRFYGRITRVSEGFASITIPASPENRGIAKATKYKRGILHFESVSVERAVEVVEAQEVDGLLEVLVAFRSLVDTEVLFPSIDLDVITSLLHINLGEQPPLSKVVEVVRRSFDLVESSRAILEATAASRSTSSVGPVTATPRVRQLVVRNPVDILIDIDPSALAVAGVMVTTVVAKFESFTKGVNNLNDTYTARQDEKRNADLHPLKAQSFQLDNLKKGAETLHILSEIDPQLLDRIGIDLEQISPELLRKVEPLKNQAVEAAAELQLNSSEPIEIGEIDPDSEEYDYFSYDDDAQ